MNAFERQDPDRARRIEAVLEGRAELSAEAARAAAASKAGRPKPVAGKDAFEAARKLGQWGDGKPFGTLHRMAFLKPMYADDLYTGDKRLEGRPLGHPISKAEPNDAGRELSARTD